ncbi:MAG: hypothetical protein U0168_12300 [Nannocystaceae bacterium]
MNPCAPPILVHHRHGAEPFSIGRLAGDLILRYETPAARAIAVARDLEAALQTARAAVGATSVRSTDVRSGVDALLAGHPVATVAGALAQRWRRWAVDPDPARLALPLSLSTALRTACERFVEAQTAAALAEDGGGIASLDALFERLAARGNAASVGTLRKQIAGEAKQQRDVAAEQALSDTILEVLRWLGAQVAGLPRLLLGDDDGDDPRDAPPPSLFGEAIDEPGLQLEESLLMVTPLALTDGSGTDRLRICGRATYQSFAADLKPWEGEFTTISGQPGNSHRFAEVALAPIDGVYISTHVVTEQDVTDAPTAEAIAGFVASLVDAAARGVLAKVIDSAASSTGIPFAGTLGNLAAGIVTDPLIDELVRRLRAQLARILGPEAFTPLVTVVPVTWPVPGVPAWSVSMQGSHGSRFGAGEIRTQLWRRLRKPSVREANPDGGYPPALYLVQLRLRVG